MFLRRFVASLAAAAFVAGVGVSPAWASTQGPSSWNCSWGESCLVFDAGDQASSSSFTGNSGSYWGQYSCSGKWFNCTNYVAYRLARNNVPNFAGGCPDGANAQSWDERARKCGIPVDSTPRPGSVIQWDAYAPTPAGTSKYTADGHVAYVDAVVGTTVYVSEASCSMHMGRRVAYTWPIAGVGSGQVEVLHPKDLQNPPSFGGATPPVGVPAAMAQSFVIKAYRAVFNREVDSGALAYWTNALVSGKSWAEVFDGLTSSDEYRGNLLASSYRTYVGREIDAGAITYWKDQMAAGMTIETVQANLLGSAEVFGQAGGNSAVWVDQVYQRALRRPASPSDVAYWTGQLGAGMLRETVARNILYSSEHLGYVIDDFYVRCFGTLADPSGKDYWLKRIQAGSTDERVFQQIFTADMSRF